MCRIVIMEDDMPLGLELAGALRADGHEVKLTTSAEQARGALWHWDYDLLITDVVIRENGRPVSDGGLGLISWVRHTTMTTAGLNYLPIIAISGEDARLGRSVLLPTANRIGADRVLEKPVDLGVLKDEICALTSATQD